MCIYNGYSSIVFWVVGGGSAVESCGFSPRSDSVSLVLYRSDILVVCILWQALQYVTYILEQVIVVVKRMVGDVEAYLSRASQIGR